MYYSQGIAERATALFVDDTTQNATWPAKFGDLLAERMGFEPMRLLGKRFSRPPRYDHFDTSP
jgi:hypothetical protein